MINKDLLEILACPETRQSLREADKALVETLNGKIAAGELTSVGGEPVKEPLEEALVREDGKVAYPLRQGIPVLLSEEGLPVPE